MAKIIHIPDAQTFRLPLHPVFQLSDVKRIAISFTTTPEGQWLEGQNTKERKLKEFETGERLYSVTHDMASHETLLTIFDKSIATAFKLQFA